MELHNYIHIKSKYSLLAHRIHRIETWCSSCSSSYNCLVVCQTYPKQDNGDNVEIMRR
jgi:hypothetical protein